MVRRTECLYQPAAGVYTDFENILQKFSETDTVRYERFAEIWREMNMSYFFAGRQSEREVREFVEECFRIAMKFWLPPYNFQVRVGGLYLIYGIYLTQPVVQKVRVRVTQSQWQTIRVFQNEAHQQQHWDVDFVFQKLRLNNAFDFVATEMEHYPSLKDVISEEIAIPDEFKEETSVLFDLFSGDVLEQFSSVHQHYHKMKVGLEGPSANHPSRSLDVINSDLVSGVTNAISHYQERRKSHSQHTKRVFSKSDSEDDNVKSAPEDDDNDVDYKPYTESSRKFKLKAKAFKQVAKAHRSRRHRQAMKEHGSKKKSKKSKSSNQEEISDHLSDLNTSTATEEEEDEEKEHNDSAELAIMSMPTFVEDVDQPATKSKGKKRAKKTGGDVSSPKKKEKSPKKKESNSETDEAMSSPKKKEKSPKKRGANSETDEDISSPKKKRKTDSPKKKQNKSETDEEVQEEKSPEIQKDKEKKPSKKKKNEKVSEKTESLNDESENSQEDSTQIDTKKTKKKNQSPKSNKSKMEKIDTDKVTDDREMPEAELQTESSPPKKKVKTAKKRKNEEIEIVNDETETAEEVDISAQKQRKMSDDATEKSPKGKKKLPKTKAAVETSKNKDKNSKKKSKNTLHVKFQLPPKHSSS